MYLIKFKLLIKLNFINHEILNQYCKFTCISENNYLKDESAFLKLF